MFPSVKYEPCTAQLEPGEVAVLYTDGITESHNKNKDEFGEERLIQAALKYRELPAQKMIEFILAEVDKFSERLEPDDDRTLVIVKRADHPG